MGVYWLKDVMICLFSVLDTLMHLYVVAHPVSLPPSGGGSSSAHILNKGLAGTCVPTVFGWSQAEIQL